MRSWAEAGEGTMPRIAALIPAGGTGTRVGSRTPKQFLALGGVSILAATVRHFARHPGVGAIVVAVPAAHVDRARRALRGLPRRAAITVVPGGPTRQESVWLALQAAPAVAEIVLVHDAVRPFITRALIDAVVDAARDGGAAICALPIVETVKRVRGDEVEATVDRAGLWTVQTPQAFRGDLLRGAHEKARRDGVVGTDDAALVERLGHHPVKVVRGLEGNLKITTPEDLRRARRMGR
jgi:2-C-methyl-D-erythritol 4-phosphate cytidylyltransferase